MTNICNHEQKMALLELNRNLMIVAHNLFFRCFDIC